MKKTLKLKALAVAVLAVVGVQSAFAQTSIANVWVGANTDNGGNTEGVFITSNGNTYGGIDGAAGARFITNGIADVYGNTTNVSGSTSATMTSGAASISAVGSGTYANSVFIKASQEVNINSSNVAGTVNIGKATSANNIYGTTSINVNTNAATDINTGSSTGNVTIGNAANTTTIQSGTNIITGADNRMTSTGDNTITASGANNISGNANTMTATTTNTISAATNNMTATTANNIQAPLNNIGTNSVATNNIGYTQAGTYASTNNIGNTNTGTTVNAYAGNASQVLANNKADTDVTGGSSQLAPRTGTPNVATSAQVLLSNGSGASVDANGKLSASGAGGQTPTVGVTLNNGYGNTNGVVVTEQQTSISGGTSTGSATTMTMNDNGARFSRAATGAPVTVTGVADGRNDFDAVNVRQFAGAVAAVAAQANVPALAAGQDRTVGLGVGSFMGKTGVAVGMNFRDTDNANAVYKLSVSGGLNGGARLVVGAGAAWAF